MGLSFIAKSVSWRPKSIFDLPSHEVIKLLLRDQAIVVLVSLLDHLLQFMLVDVFAQILDNPLQILDRDEAGFLVVE